MKRRQLLVVLAGAVVLLGSRAWAADHRHVQKAIDRGVAALRSLQTADGTWVNREPNDPGMTALAVLTLVECGARPDDPAVQTAAEAVRRYVPELHDTYSIALAILLLDRLQDSDDVPLIQVLAIRLMYGQQPSGAWGYECPYRVGGEMESTVFARRNPGDSRPRKESIKPGATTNSAKKELSQDVKELIRAYATQAGDGQRVEARQRGRIGRFGAGGEDHSNTQFATLGLWVARRHGIPVDNALRAVDAHYRQCQNPDGGWGYHANGMSTNTMTAAGILGLAAGAGAGAGQGGARAGDPAMKKALQALGATIGAPMGGGAVQPIAPPVGRRGPGRGRGPAALPPAGPGGPSVGRLYYFLWSLERVAVRLDLKTIGHKDWYNWGANVLLASQGNDGQWRGEFWRGGADTCFALLFLVRSNLVKDLTVTLRGTTIDSGQATLKAGPGNADTTEPRPLKPTVEPTTQPTASPARPRPQPAPPSRAPVATLEPPLKAVAPSDSVDAARLAAEIVRAPAGQLDAILRRESDAKGVAHTEALAAAIPQLPKDSKKKAREALAERLSHMRTVSLVNYLKDDDAEIRRGAALALAMKGSNEHVFELISLLNDQADTVVLGARAALKELTGQDFGPSPGASANDKTRAVFAWLSWWQKHKGS